MSSDGASVRIIGGHSEDERESGFYEALKQQQQAEQQGRRGLATYDASHNVFPPPQSFVHSFHILF